MNDLTTFILARIAEDETRAEGTLPLYPQPVGVAGHDARRVLAECKAKRVIVESWREADSLYGGDAGAYMDGVLRALASVHADHPDYRTEWV